MNKYILGVVGLMFSTGAAYAATPSGYDLYQQCTGSNIDQIACMGYILGVNDGLLLGAGLQDSAGICQTSAISAGQGQMIYNKWARSNPEMLNRFQGIAVAAALKSAFPCAATSDSNKKEPALLRQ